MLLLSVITLVLPSGEATQHGNGTDLVHFLKNISLNEQRRPVNVTVRPKDKPVPEETPGPMVLTKNGPVRGVTVEKAHVFYGVPYAEPPIGAYRWKPPRPLSPWTGVYNASFPRASCMQDCDGANPEECPKKVRNMMVFCFPAQFMFLTCHFICLSH